MVYLKTGGSPVNTGYDWMISRHHHLRTNPNRYFQNPGTMLGACLVTCTSTHGNHRVMVHGYPKRPAMFGLVNPMALTTWLATPTIIPMVSKPNKNICIRAQMSHIICALGPPGTFSWRVSQNPWDTIVLPRFVESCIGYHLLGQKGEFLICHLPSSEVLAKGCQKLLLQDVKITHHSHHS